MKIIRSLFLVMIVITSVIACKEKQELITTSVPIDRFWGIGLPYSKLGLMKTLEEKGYKDTDIEYVEQSDSYGVMNPQFAGTTFDMVTFRMYQNYVMYEAVFYSVFTPYQYDDAYNLLNNLLNQFAIKYGEPNEIEDSEETSYYWEDKDNNFILLETEDNQRISGVYKTVLLRYVNYEYYNKQQGEYIDDI